jgi:hypothetical protein
MTLLAVAKSLLCQLTHMTTRRSARRLIRSDDEMPGVDLYRSLAVTACNSFYLFEARSRAKRPICCQLAA